MKVLYVANGLSHYFNLFLSRLNSEPGIELVVIAPIGLSADVGDNVYQTKDGVNFKVIELEEIRRFGFYTTFKGLTKALLQEKPDVVMIYGDYPRTFYLDVSIKIAMKKLRAALVYKSIPFRFPSYKEAGSNLDGFSSLPPLINRILIAIGAIKLARLLKAAIDKRALCNVDAHVNYIEANDLWASYGIPKEKIFVTCNSPDTDLLFSVRSSLTNLPQILPSNPYRLLHVGRLVEWKRVDMLMRVFARIRVCFPSAELLIIGSGPEEDGLKKLGQDLHLGESVIFMGSVYDPHLLGQYYLSSSLYVLAGMGGLSINEAMCFGLPILCSVCDGTEKILVREGVNGRYFCDGNEDSLLEKITWFFEHPDQMKKMGYESEKIIRKEVNIHTVISGYIQAFRYAYTSRFTTTSNRASC